MSDGSPVLEEGHHRADEVKERNGVEQINDEDRAGQRHSDDSPSRGSHGHRYRSRTSRDKGGDVDRYDRRDRRRRSRDRYGYSRRGGDRRSRSRSRSRSRNHRSRDYPGRRRSSSRDRRRRRDDRDFRHERRDRYRDTEAHPKTALSSAEDELKQLERTYRTVQVYNLSLRAEERDIFEFFKQAGRVVDIRIIRDRTTGRSKGFAYVEFEDRDSVVQAISLGGQPLLGQPVMVKMSEAEKNLAWEAAQAAKKQAASGKPSLSEAGPALGALGAGIPGRLTVSNLPVNIVEADLRPILEAFGSLDFVTVQRDAAGVSIGKAVVQYKMASDAEVATVKLNEEGIELAPGLPMQLALDKPLDLSANLSGPGGGTVGGAPNLAELPSALDEKVDIDADDGGGLKLTAQNRLALMSRLAANAGMDVPAIPSTLSFGATKEVASQAVLTQAATELALEQGLLGPASPIPTQCLLIKNMFNPAQEAGADWDEEIAEDVKEECSKYGRVEFVHVDKQSKGFVYLKFDSTSSATVAQKALHGRWFDQRQLLVEYQFTPIFNSHFKL